MPAALVLATALVAWGPVAPAPGPASAGAAARPASVVTAPVTVAPAPPPSVPAGPPAASARPAMLATPIIAKGPLDVHATPALVAPPRAASAKQRPPLQKRWQFWVIAGGLFATSIAVTVAVTRPGPQPYTGNVMPYIITFP